MTDFSVTKELPPKKAPLRSSTKRKSPPPGTIVLDKSCKRCRIRKVRCDRRPPLCSNCRERAEECDLGDLALNQKLPKKAMNTKVVEETEEARIARLEQRLALLESQQPAEYHVATRPNFPQPPGNFSSFHFDEVGPTPAAIARRLSAPIGEESIDARLSRPQMERSLSQHLCEAFLESCCSHLPAFNWFHSRLPDFRGDLSNLSGSAKVSIAAFSAIGARASPHSSLLGIASSPYDAIAHPLSPLLNAGTRRESACRVLLDQSHLLFHENGLADEATADNLAACLALMQMAIFVEIEPKKSRSLVRVALGHYKELQDQAKSDPERAAIKKCFALSLYSGDAITSSYGRKTVLISQTDLINYFNFCGIIIPNFSDENLLKILEKLLDFSSVQFGEKAVRIKTATHAIGCWVWGSMRLWSTISAPPIHTTQELLMVIPPLWKAIDQTISGINFMKSAIRNSTESGLDSSHSSHTHDHSSDYLTMIGRFERDLLDIINMIHVLLEERRKSGQISFATKVGQKRFKEEEIWRASNSRVRKGLRSLAGYAKEYIAARDKHLTFHLIFQMQLLPTWTTIALQRFNPTTAEESRELWDGPEFEADEVTSTEIQWLIEGLQHACYYMPAAERRLAELLDHRFEIIKEGSSFGGSRNGASASPRSSTEKGSPLFGDVHSYAASPSGSYSMLSPADLIPNSNYDQSPFTSNEESFDFLSPQNNNPLDLPFFLNTS